MKPFLVFLYSMISMATYSQTIIGKWQLMKQTTCASDKLDDPNQNEDMDELMSDFNSMKSRTPSIIEFKEKMKAQQSTAVLGKRKDADEKNFLYKIDEKNLYLLDKRSRTILTSYTIEEFTNQKLILSETNRPCETRVFERIK